MILDLENIGCFMLLRPSLEDLQSWPDTDTPDFVQPYLGVWELMVSPFHRYTMVWPLFVSLFVSPFSPLPVSQRHIAAKGFGMNPAEDDVKTMQPFRP